MKYLVVAEMTISVSVRVEAKNEEEAKEKALEAGVQGLCHQCARGDYDVWSTSGELDGEPMITEVQKL